MLLNLATARDERFELVELRTGKLHDYQDVLHLQPSTRQRMLDRLVKEWSPAAEAGRFAIRGTREPY